MLFFRCVQHERRLKNRKLECGVALVLVLHMLAAYAYHLYPLLMLIAYARRLYFASIRICVLMSRSDTPHLEITK